MKQYPITYQGREHAKQYKSRRKQPKSDAQRHPLYNTHNTYYSGNHYIIKCYVAFEYHELVVRNSSGKWPTRVCLYYAYRSECISSGFGAALTNNPARLIESSIESESYA